MSTPTNTAPTAPAGLPNGLPNNPVGRRLHAQTQISAWLSEFEKTASEEGKKEVLRIQRFLGFAEKAARAPRTSATPAPTTPASPTPSTPNAQGSQKK